MPQPIVQVDAFAHRPFTGNPAAVCVLPAARDDAWMQQVAMEMNLSETAFLHPVDDGYRLRWFTPQVEIALCGHATLASAHVLWENEVLPADGEARFHTASGVLSCRREGEWIWMDFPAKPATQAEPVEGLAQALGVQPAWLGRSQYDLLVRVDDAAQVRALSPDFGALKKVEARGVMVTAPADEEARALGADIVSRFFAPSVGVDEDPVTGSAHCVLAPYWSALLGRDQLTGYQASPRGGIVRLRHAGERVHLGGQAITLLRGELLA
jgi:PhzF family phenazine biosynthesis protein